MIAKKKNGTAARRPTKHLAALLQLAAEADPGIKSPEEMRPLTRAQRTAIATLLYALARDEDVREVLFEKPIKNRPTDAADQERKFYTVLNIVLDVADEIEESAAKSAAAIDWKLSPDQVKHALTQHREQAEFLVKHLDQKMLRALVKKRAGKK